jgi:single-strand DNA-binding protein
MPSYDLNGTVKLIMDQQTFKSGFTKREFIVTTEEERFPQDIKFECVKEKCALLDNLEPGQHVTVSFDLRGNEYNGRYFVNLNAWRIEGEPGANLQDNVPPQEEGPPIDQMEEPPAEELSDDDLPF